MRKLMALLAIFFLFPFASLAEDAPEFTPVAEDELYQLGDNADRIAEVKAKLKELGYYKKDDNIEGGQFTRRLRTRVYDFQRYNGIKANGVLDANTIRSILSESSLSKSASFNLFKEDASKEPENLITYEQVYCAEDRSNFFAKVVNESAHKTITAFQLVFKLYDSWGEPLHDGYYTVDTIAEIQPGAKKDSNYLYLDYPLRTYTVEVAFSKVRYSDDTIYEVPEDELFFYILKLVEFK